MESRRSLKYVRMLLMATPFLVPLFIGLVEEVCGRVIAWNYAMVSLFVVSLIALYAWGVVEAFSCKYKADRLYELFMFHVVKIPLFVLVWFVHAIIFMIYCLCVNGFDGIQ
jgi:hypothetical protein